MLFTSAVGSLLVAARVSATATSTSHDLQPDHTSARTRAHHIFRAINNAGRQWGSAMNHNGFGFFPAVVPAGTVLYHGSQFNTTPETFEWLAFEPEHGEAFGLDARIASQNTRTSPRPEPFHQAGGAQKALRGRRDGRDQSALVDIGPGYFHTYQATKDLHALYIDGMSGGKTDLGTMDAELYVLFGDPDENYEHGEYDRAQAICSDITGWGYDGYIRMEAGYEYIHCDFSKDLDTVSIVPAYDYRGVLSASTMLFFQWARAVAEDYDGVGTDRLKIDYSSMVSGLFYPLNITTMEPERPDLMRLATAGFDELQKLKPHLERISRAPRRFTVDWQAVTDGVVRRHADRLQLMAAEGISAEHLIDEIEAVARSYVAAPSLHRDTRAPLTPEERAVAIARCIDQPLLPARFKRKQWAREDELIDVAMEAVMTDICRTIIGSYDDLRMAAVKDGAGPGETSGKHVRKAAEIVHGDVQELIKKLGWSQWKKVRPCALDEVLFTVMWPFGNDEDYFTPACQSIASLYMERNGYFRDHFPGGHAPWNRHRSSS